jgi:hypothetical protein
VRTSLQSRTIERGGKGDCLKEGGGEEGERERPGERAPRLGQLSYHHDHHDHHDARRGPPSHGDRAHGVRFEKRNSQVKSGF